MKDFIENFIFIFFLFIFSLIGIFFKYHVDICIATLSISAVLLFLGIVVELITLRK